MELNRRNGLIWATAAFGFVAILLFARLSSFGIWDPWELNPADQARHLLAGDAVEVSEPILSTVLVALGFGTFGVREWAGRFPLAVAGLAAVLLAYLLVRRFAGRRAGIYAALVTGTTPLFLFNARQMLGDAPAFAAQALLAWAACAAVFRPTTRAEADARGRWTWTGVWLAVAIVIALPLAVLSSGALLGALPPLLAVVAVGAASGLPLRPRADVQRAAAYYVLAALTAVVGFLVVGAVVADHAEFSLWLGGKPRGGDPPTFEMPLEAVFHAFVPWSALVPVALGRMLVGREDAEGATDDAVAVPENAVRLVLLLWAVFGYGALVVYESRYGPGTFLPVVALAAAVGIALRDVEESRSPWWASAVVAALLVGLLVRDFGLYPGGPIGGLGIEEVSVPEVFNPKRVWAALLGVFALTALLGFGSAPGSDRPDLRAPYRLLIAQWKKGLSYKLWLIAGGVLLLFFVLVGLGTLVMPDALGLTTLVIKWARRLMLVPVVVPAAVAAGQLALWAFRKLGDKRLLPLLVAGAAVGAYAAQGYLPALSSHFSPREVYDSFNLLSEPNEPLAEYRVGGRAAAYYARGEVRDVESQAQLVEFLDSEQRRWAAFPTDELAQIDRAFRQRTGRHLFVADARSARVVLATSHPIAERENESFVAKYVIEEAPTPQHPVGARFEDKIELVGYDLTLPHDGYVGAGESFTITWYWRALKPTPGSWKPFVHVDGQGLRLNGDHDPVDGKYPIRLWDEGDVVVDVQELTVPANYRPGSYTIFIGLYAGDNRLEVVEGPEAEDNRVRAGVLRIR